MCTYGTISSIFVDIQPDFMNIKMTLVYTLLYVQLIVRIPFNLGTRDVFYVRREVGLMKTAKANAYIMHIFGKIELLSIHAT